MNAIVNTAVAPAVPGWLIGVSQPPYSQGDPAPGLPETSLGQLVAAGGFAAVLDARFEADFGGRTPEESGFQTSIRNSADQALRFDMARLFGRPTIGPSPTGPEIPAFSPDRERPDESVTLDQRAGFPGPGSESESSSSLNPDGEAERARQSVSQKPEEPVSQYDPVALTGDGAGSTRSGGIEGSRSGTLREAPASLPELRTPIYSPRARTALTFKGSRCEETAAPDRRLQDTRARTVARLGAINLVVSQEAEQLTVTTRIAGLTEPQALLLAQDLRKAVEVEGRKLGSLTINGRAQTGTRRS